jgi:deazaflavin-dependent oxidoreductase (nitroreductase family)
MRNAILSAVALILALALVGVIFVVGMRRKSPIVLKAVRRSGRAVKPLILRSAGTASSPTAVVEHVGRTSGRRYETPVVAAPTDDGFVIALPYGPNTDWLKNVRTAGHATIRFGGASYDVDHPELVDIQQVDDRFAPKEQRLHRRFQVRDAVMVRTLSSVMR